jgi:DNA (cytosine-5)-methyltransferase 1
VNAIKICELFAGIGGFRLGLENASCQFKTVFANEWDKWAASIYRHHWPDNTLQEGDIKNIQTQDLPDFDLLVGGFPCQPYSVAGQRFGFSDSRGTVFYELLRIAKDKQPKMLFLENVPGLLSIDHGNVFETMLKALAELGYILEWSVLDSKYFGVPQQRRRVFIVGYFAAISRGGGTIFPIQPSNSKCPKKAARNKVSTTLTASYGAKGNIGGGTFVTKQIVPTITAHISKLGGSDPLIVQSRMQGEVRVYDDHVSTLRASMGTGGNNVPMVSMILGDHTGGNIKQRTRTALDNPSWTLGGCQTLINENQVIRRLTPTECERLQGFPDNWTRHGQTLKGETIEISKTQRYKTLGNAVTTNVITAIGELILNFLNKKETAQ